LYPQILKEHYRAFTIIQIEKLYCKIRKLEILQLLIDDTNVQLILDELVHHTRSNQVPLAAAAVKLLGRTSQRHPKYLKRSIRVLVDLLKSGSAEVKNHVIEAFCSIMNQVRE
jgi:AP-3 complex subunit beta